MVIAASYPHIEVDGQGTPRIGKTRYDVIHLAGEHYHYGWSAEELLRQHPDLRPEEVYSSLTYFYDHYADVVRQLAEIGDRIEKMRDNQALSREQLLQRGKITEPS